MSFITLIIVISVLVFVHEFGHFIVAKKLGVRVDEFSIGFPPRIWSIKKGETTYSINLIPFGGYVKIFGENYDDALSKGDGGARSFVSVGRSAQAAILVAGVLMNVLFAWALISASFMIGVSQGASGSDVPDLVIATEILPGSPAEEAGLREGDVIISITDAKGDKHEDLSSSSIEKLIASSAAKGLVLEYQRGKEIFSTNISPKDGVVPGKLAIGIAMADAKNVKLSFMSAIIEGAKSTWELTVMTVYGIIGFIGEALSFKANLSHVSGPVGIAGYLNQAREFGASALFAFVALISLNLAVINLLPFPALDGGRLLFVAIEAIIRKPINPKFANAVNLVGFGLLMLLMVAITFSDIGKLVH